MPEIIYKLGIFPRDWKERKDGIWANSEIEEAVPFRGSSFSNPSYGGSAALNLGSARSSGLYSASFRSALYLEDWGRVTKLL